MESLSTLLLSFTVDHPGVMWLAVAALGAAAIVIWRQTKTIRTWQDRADERQDALQHSRNALREAKEHNQQLATEIQNHHEQLAYWFKLGNCLDQKWAIVGLKRVRKSSGYEQDKVNEEREHIGQADNIFDPMPPPPTKRPATTTDYELAIVLASNVGNGKFNVLVVRPADMNKFPSERLADVDAWPLSNVNGWGFYIRKSSEGTGAASHALDYIITRAKAEEVPILEATLIHVENEAHRIRLCHFYARKYGFTYRPSAANPNGYITKDLKQPEKSR